MRFAYAGMCSRVCAVAVSCGLAACGSGTDGGAGGGAGSSGCLTAGPATVVVKDVGSAFGVDGERAFWATPGTWQDDIALSPSQVWLAKLATGEKTLISPGEASRALNVAAGADTLYWTTWEAVRAAPMSGGAPATLFGGGGSLIAVDANNIYWVFDTTLKKAPIAGGDSEALTSDPGSAGYAALAVSGAYAYLARRNVGDPATVSILKVRIAGGAPEVLATVEGSAGGIAVDSTHVYWTVVSWTAILPPISSPRVMKVPIAGGEAVAIASWPDGPHGSAESLGVNDSAVYVVNRGSLWQVPIAGGEKKVLHSGLALGDAIAVQGCAVYFRDNDLLKIDLE